MTTGIRSDASGTFGALTFGGDDVATFDATGIQAGSYKAKSIDNAALADGALIENAPVRIGYGPGAGGTVTQATSKSTAVTLNKPCGRITTHTAALAAGASVLFTVNNTVFGENDLLILSPVDSINYRVETVFSVSGQFGIRLTNLSEGSLSDAVVINFAIIKGALS